MTAPVEEYRSRVARARALMRERGMDGLVVTDPTTFYYFSGQSAPAWMKQRPNVFVLPLEGAPAIVTWSGPGMFARLYRRPYPSWVEDRRIYPEVPFTDERRVDWGIRAVLEERGLAAAVIGIELGRDTLLAIPVNDFLRLREELPRARFVESGPVVWGCRTIKSEWEIEAQRKACAIGGAAWKKCLAELRPGVTQTDIQKRILALYLDEGADPGAEPPLALGARGEGGAFRKGDVLYLDDACVSMHHLTNAWCIVNPRKPSSHVIHLHVVRYLGVVNRHAHNANSKCRILSDCRVKRSTDKAVLHNLKVLSTNGTSLIWRTGVLCADRQTDWCSLC